MIEYFRYITNSFSDRSNNFSNIRVLLLILVLWKTNLFVDDFGLYKIQQKDSRPELRANNNNNNKFKVKKEEDIYIYTLNFFSIPAETSKLCAE